MCVAGMFSSQPIVGGPFLRASRLTKPWRFGILSGSADLMGAPKAFKAWFCLISAAMDCARWGPRKEDDPKSLARSSRMV